MNKSPWGKVGAWAEEAERAEAEEREAAAAQPPPTFPSLKESVTTAIKQKKKTKMTLQEFNLQQSGYSGGSAPSRGLTPEEMMRLPTGPKERSPDEMQSGRLGGGFSNYGTRPGSNQDRGRDFEGRRSYGFDDDNRRGPARVSEPIQPSRADAVDNWAPINKPLERPEYSSGPARTGSKYSSLGGGGGPGIASRADDVANWNADKKPVSYPEETRSSRFGSGFSRPEPDRWNRNEPQRLVLDAPKSEVEGEVVVKVNKPNPFGAARPREDVLAEKGLDWKKLDLDIHAKKQNSVSGGSRPTSSQSSRPGTPHSSLSEVAVGEDGMVKQKPKVNPFGDAKPREVLLEQKGLDWKKIDLELEHKRVERDETEEEKNLREQIVHLKKDLAQTTNNDQSNINDLIQKKEQELELLTRQLDDKVRYSQKIFDRQGSGIGRGADRPPSRSGGYEEPRTGFPDKPSSRPPSRPGAYDDPGTGFAERPPSRPGAYDDPRSNFNERPRSRPGAYDEPRGGFPRRYSDMSGAYQEPRGVDYNERPRSRGAVNSWTKAGDDRGANHGGGGRGFLGHRDVDRSGSRW